MASFTLLIIIIIALIVVITWKFRRPPIDIRSAVTAAQATSLLSRIPNRLPEEYPADTLWLRNNTFSVLYFKTIRSDDKIAETLDFVVSGLSGGMIVTFVDGKIFRWTRNGVTLSNPEASTSNGYLAHQLLQEVRKAAAASR